MNKATELMQRTVQRLTELGYTLREATRYGTVYILDQHSHAKGSRWLYLTTTYRNNGTDEDVTVTIEVYEVTNEIFQASKRLDRIKVPKQASDKVLNNRIQKAIAYL